jgi:hypothetical protein
MNPLGKGFRMNQNCWQATNRCIYGLGPANPNNGRTCHRVIGTLYYYESNSFPAAKISNIKVLVD